MRGVVGIKDTGSFVSAGRYHKSPAHLKSETFQPPKIVACVKRSRGNNAQQDQSTQQRKVTCSLKKHLSQATPPARPRKRSNIETRQHPEENLQRIRSSPTMSTRRNAAACTTTSIYRHVYESEPYLRRATSNDDRVQVRAKASSTS